MKPLSILALSLTLATAAVPFSPIAVSPAEQQKTKKVIPIRRPPGFEENKRKAEAQRQAVESGQLTLRAEEEAAPAPTRRAPVISTGFDGMDFGDSPDSVPPDTHAATGPNHIVEVVNSAIAIFNRTGGVAVAPQLLADFFTGVAISGCIFDPVVAYDELAQRFYVGALDVPELCGDPPANTARLLYAVSNSFDPTAGFTHMYAIDVDETSNSGCGLSTPVGGDFTRTGWNADAHVFTFNMFDFPGTCYDHVAVITIDKSTIDTGTLGFTHADRSGSTNFTLVPVVMHGSSLGDPMWFLESVFFNQIRVVKMTNVLSSTPTFTDTDISVASYGFPPSATQSGGGTFIETNDTRILNAEWRNNRLVATHTVGVSGVASARWYEFNTSTSTPTLTQQGTISPGSGIHTYFPSIAISADGDLGMTFMQSSTAQFMSMYVTGKLIADPLGTMQTPVLAKAGQANYIAFDCDGVPPGESNVCRAGDYSGITVDPDLTNTFCAANEYATSAGSNNWGTHISCFSLGTHDLAVTAISAPKTAKGSPVTLPVKVTIQNRSDHGETVQSSDLGDGVSIGLVRLSVSVVDDDGELCAPAIVALDGGANAALFAGGPVVIATGKKLTVNYLVTYNCSSPLAIKGDPTPGDYSHTATVHHEALAGGIADNHAFDDTCPRAALFDPNPPPKGTKDKGCGSKGGGPVVTNVTP
jgi:hypothetical protein